MAIKRPVAGVIENKYSIDFEGLGGVGRVYWAWDWPSILVIVIREDLVERPDRRECLEDITWRYDVLETIPIPLSARLLVSDMFNSHFSDPSALIAISASYQNSLVLQTLEGWRPVNKLLKWCVGLNEVLFGEGHA